jgi:hypothetical protein
MWSRRCRIASNAKLNYWLSLRGQPRRLTPFTPALLASSLVRQARGRRYRERFQERPGVVVLLLETERLLVNVRAQMEPLDRDIGAVQYAREQSPEVLHWRRGARVT